jgi:hypothetical protein
MKSSTVCQGCNVQLGRCACVKHQTDFLISNFALVHACIGFGDSVLHFAPAPRQLDLVTPVLFLIAHLLTFSQPRCVNTPMRNSRTTPVLLAVAGFCATLMTARATIYTPVADGSVYFTGNTPGGYVEMAQGSIEGDLHFASFNAAYDSSIQLELNPYAEPLFASTLYVYGFDNASASLSGSDWNAGTYLGTWVLPANLGFGQETFFDVTSFVQSVQGQYFGFEIQAVGGPDQFSSTTINYGTPPELIAVPEPGTTSLTAMAATSTVLLARCRRSRNQCWTAPR